MPATYTCAECGHLHFLSPEDGYCECPIEGCDCQGQEWARLDRQSAEQRTPADEIETYVGLGDFDGGED